MKLIRRIAVAMLVSVLAASFSGAFASRGNAQAVPQQQLKCFFCAELYRIPTPVYHCEQGFGAPPLGSQCWAWLDEYGLSHCSVAGECPALFEEVSTEAATALLQEAGLPDVRESVDYTVWRRGGCNGEAEAVYVQTAGDRFVPVEATGHSGTI